MADSTYKLIYFDGRGRAEIARYIFTLAGQEFVDQRIGDDEWAQLKPATPYGQVPVLEVDGKAYCESTAIHRFVARQFGFYGSSNLDGLLIDQITGVLGDVLTEALNIAWVLPEGEDKTKALNKFKTEVVPKLVNFLETQLGTKKWFLGDTVSLADVAVFELLTNDVSRLAGNGWQEQSPRLKALVDNFASQPAIASYLAKRAESPF